MEIDLLTTFKRDFVPQTHLLSREPGLSRTLRAALLAGLQTAIFGRRKR